MRSNESLRGSLAIEGAKFDWPISLPSVPERICTDADSAVANTTGRPCHDFDNREYAMRRPLQLLEEIILQVAPSAR